MYGQPNYGFQQPGYMAPQPPMYMAPQPPMYPPQQNQTVIIMNDPKQPTIKGLDTSQNVVLCRYCSGKTKNILRRSAGCVTFSWCICLLATTGFFFWVPFCCDGCKDTQFMCQKCGNIKSKLPANCC